MKVATAEVAGVLERPPIVEMDVATLARDQSIGLERLEHEVDVNRGETRRVRKLLLGQWELEPMIAGEAPGLEADRKLAQDVRDARASIAAADIIRPFAKD